MTFRDKGPFCHFGHSVVHFHSKQDGYLVLATFWLSVYVMQQPNQAPIRRISCVLLLMPPECSNAGGGAVC